MPRSGTWWLSERLYWKKIRVKCECGVKRQYDAKALFDRIGDRSMPALLGEISAAIGCENSANVYRDRCKLTYSAGIGCAVRQRSENPSPRAANAMQEV